MRMTLTERHYQLCSRQHYYFPVLGKIWLGSQYYYNCWEEWVRCTRSPVERNSLHTCRILMSLTFLLTFLSPPLLLCCVCNSLRNVQKLYSRAVVVQKL
jgi:hypothetical protein